MRKTKADKSFSSKKYKPYTLITEYLSDVFFLHKEQDGYVCFRSGPNDRAAQSWLDVGRLENTAVELSRHDYRDTYFTFSTYRKSKEPRRTTFALTNIFAWSIDVDYKNESAHPLDVYRYIMDNVNIPAPNYVEYGHRLRMIYLFREPLRLFKGQRRRLLKGFEFLQKAFCQVINDELGFGESFGAEANPPTTFFRVPGSINTKDGSTISIMHVTDERYTMQELFDEYIPNAVLDPSGNRKEWYDAWQAKNASLTEGQKLARRYNFRTLWEKRLSAFEKLQSESDPRRKRLCFLYANGLIQSGRAKDVKELAGLMEAFNSKFSCPLSPRQLERTFRWNAKSMRCYAYSNRKLAEMLEIDREIFEGKSRKERDAERYKAKREKAIKNGRTKAQKMKKRQARVFAMLSEGLALNQIAERLGISLATVKRDAREIKKTPEAEWESIAAESTDATNVSKNDNACYFISQDTPFQGVAASQASLAPIRGLCCQLPCQSALSCGQAERYLKKKPAVTPACIRTRFQESLPAEGLAHSFTKDGANKQPAFNLRKQEAPHTTAAQMSANGSRHAPTGPP